MTTTDRPTAAPDLELFEPGAKLDPFPVYRRLLEESPVIWYEPFDEWIFTRYADVETIVRDPRFSSNPRHRRGRPSFEGDVRVMAEGLGLSVLLFMDPPDHTRVRRLVSSAFTPRRMELMRADIQSLVDGILD